MFTFKNEMKLNVAIIFLLTTSLSRGQVLVDLVRDFETSILNTRIPDTIQFLAKYDFIIVGGGSAGCVVANRLSEIKNVTVLLLEAGDQETVLSDVPLTAALTQMTRYNWGYKTEKEQNACQGLKGGVCNWPKGRGVGGTSLINFMVYTRGHKKDYDYWAEMGNTEWSYDQVLPYFKKSENIGIDDLRKSKFHGLNGPLDVQYSSYSSKLLKAFLNAGREMGYQVTDPNGEQLMGFSRAPATIRNGRRCSTSKAFIRPVISRPNLHIAMKSWVTKILIDPMTKKAIGVEFTKNKKKYIVRAELEVILSAGTVASPQLLMLSGVGPQEDLMAFNISVLQNLKVGYNLQDHVILSGLTFLVNQSITLNDRKLLNSTNILQYLLNGRGPYTLPGGAEAVAFVKTLNSVDGEDYPNMEVVLGAGSLSGDTFGTLRDVVGIPDEFYKKIFKNIQDKEAFGLVPVLLRPKSKGRISLRSKSPFHWPKMQPNYMQHPDDIQAMIQGINITLQIAATKAMRKLGTNFHMTPFLGCDQKIFGSDDYWKCCLRRYGSSLQHQTGTCKMGPMTDQDAVVDPRLRVHGIRRLRVIDASIMPSIPAGHTNAIVIMIAEKAADMIKSDWRLN